MIFRRKKENFIKKIFTHNVSTSLIGLGIIIFISIPLAKNTSKRYDINQEIIKLQAEINEMEKKNTELSGMVEYLESDQFIAEQAKLNLNYKQAGEEMVVIKDKDAETASTETGDKNSVFDIKGIDKDPKKPAGNPEQWWNYFFNKNII